MNETRLTEIEDLLPTGHCYECGSDEYAYELIAAIRDLQTKLLIASESGNAEAGEHEQLKQELEFVRGQRDTWHTEALVLSEKVDAVLAINHQHETSSHCVGCWERGGQDGAVS